MLGEMADALVLGGQRVLPEAAQRNGFVFRYPTLESALRDIYRDGSKS
jgi:NAD dependent epimerase/dehydratase family enzyme